MSAPATRGAFPVSRQGVMAYLVAALVVIADQALKYWLLAVYRLGDRGVVTLVGPLKLRLVWNAGVSFGFLQEDAAWTRWALVAFSAGVALALAVWARRPRRAVLAVAAGLLIGGAIGNMIDRLRQGAVVDFVDASALRFPWIFNVADSAITIGVALLLLDGFLPRREPPG